MHRHGTAVCWNKSTSSCLASLVSPAFHSLISRSSLASLTDPIQQQPAWSITLRYVFAKKYNFSFTKGLKGNPEISLQHFISQRQWGAQEEHTCSSTPVLCSRTRQEIQLHTASMPPRAVRPLPRAFNTSVPLFFFSLCLPGKPNAECSLQQHLVYNFRFWKGTETREGMRNAEQSVTPICTCFVCHLLVLQTFPSTLSLLQGWKFTRDLNCVLVHVLCFVWAVFTCICNKLAELL